MKNIQLRDYFAGQVICGMASVKGVDFGGPLESAKTAYHIADAMMKASEMHGPYLVRKGGVAPIDEN